MISEPTIEPRTSRASESRAERSPGRPLSGEGWHWIAASAGATAALALIGWWAYVNTAQTPETVALVLFALLAGTVALALAVGRYAPDLRAEPQRFGLYRLEGKIEEGGVATVHRAVHAVLKRPTAVKVLKPHLATDELIARFEREVMLASRLQHPATVEIYDYGRTREGTFYFAMEYIDGLTLARVVELDGPQPVPRVAHILKQVCESLREAHGKGLVHRDMKPQNIMLAERGGESDVVKVLDWGLIKDVRGADDTRDITRYARFLGTPAYMPPERVRDPAQAGPAVDIYGLGAVGDFLLTGRRLFDAPNEFDLTRLVVEADAPRVAENAAQPIPPALDAIIARSLAKDPAARPQSVDELIVVFTEILRAEPWTERDATRAGGSAEGVGSLPAKDPARSARHLRFWCGDACQSNKS